MLDRHRHARPRPEGRGAAARDRWRTLWRTLGPPAAPLARLRWAFLCFAVFFVVTFAPQLLTNHERGLAVRLAAVLLLLALGAWWVRCYARARFPAPGAVLECAAFVACVLVPADPFKALGLAYISINFRGLYGGWRAVAGFATMTIATFALAVAAAPSFGSLDRTALLPYTLTGMPVLALITHLVARTSRATERAAARERLLSRAGLAIAEADGAASAVAVATRAVADLLHDVPGARARVLEETPGREHAEGTGGAGASVDLPVRVDAGRELTLRVTSDRALPAEAGSALSVLTAQLALALRTCALTEELRHHAHHDALTGLANRRTVDQRLEGLRREPSRSGAVALLTLDLDGFKAVNDTHGHGVGDQLLVAVARRLRAQVRPEDLVARLGGDEFFVLLSSARPAQVEDTAARLRDAVAQPFDLDGLRVQISVSIGVASAHGGIGVDELVRRSDAAVYRAKRAGRDRVHHADPAPAAPGTPPARGSDRSPARTS